MLDMLARVTSLLSGGVRAVTRPRCTCGPGMNIFHGISRVLAARYRCEGSVACSRDPWTPAPAFRTRG
jgi:hypothetical protein